MGKGAEYFKAEGLDADAVVVERIADDMLPFQFQVISVMHHSMGTVNAFESGEFGIPPKMELMSYSALSDMLNKTLDELKAVSADSVNQAAGKPLTFKMGETQIPFTSENFVLSFSIPNLNFHATTAYDILRKKGVSIGKLDYLGNMRVGV
jgi:hypothetical protein